MANEQSTSRTKINHFYDIKSLNEQNAIVAIYTSMYEHIFLYG